MKNVRIIITLGSDPWEECDDIVQRLKDIGICDECIKVEVSDG